jgi:hypothetical protein
MPDNHIGNRRTFKRHDLDALLPVVVQRVHAAEFVSQPDIARAYRVYKSTVTRWKQLALSRGLTNNHDWSMGLLLGRMNKTSHREAPVETKDNNK